MNDQNWLPRKDQRCGNCYYYIAPPGAQQGYCHAIPPSCHIIEIIPGGLVFGQKVQPTVRTQGFFSPTSEGIWCGAWKIQTQEEA